MLRLVLLIGLLLAGCSDPPPPRRYESAAAAQPVTRVFQFGEASLTVIDVPVQSGRRVEFTRCMLWQSPRTETFHCPQDDVGSPVVQPDPDVSSAAERY